MRKCYFHICLILLALTLFGTSAGASNRKGNPIDDALDRYEAICNRSIVLKQRANAGETISSASVTSLLEQLASLRQTLSGSGQMTAEQRQRFSRIKENYRRGLISQDTKPTYIDSLFILPDPLEYAKSEDTSSPTESLAFITKPAPRLQILVLPQLEVMPTIGYGVMLGAQFRMFGIYAKATSNFKSSVSDYECESSGATTYGTIWTSGETRKSLMTISCGAILRNCYCSLHPTVGIGYGKYSVLWEDTSGDWAKVSDLSASGVMPELGAIYTSGHLALSASAGAIISSEIRPVINFGVGIRF